MTRHNIVVNKVSQYVKVYKSTGLIGNHLNSGAKYDIVVANILYIPIRTMMMSIIENLSTGGSLILSGLNLNNQGT